jgi:hypothetical protein
LGATEYDKIEDMSKFQIKMEKALKKFVKDWKTLDQNKINYLMQYAIVQEVMKVEERKCLRRELENKPKHEKKHKAADKSDLGMNKDIQNVS